jgi:hypothetical protein
MADGPAPHPFDTARATRFRPRQGFEKTAVLVDLADPQATTVLTTPFGEQRMTGAFYVVAEGDASYGAARQEFEESHSAVGANRWVKSSVVTAYRSDVACAVDTVVGDRLETTVHARPGDWIVRQDTGELMVLGPSEFAERYVRDESTGRALT